jgi:hypothetical protein
MSGMTSERTAARRHGDGTLAPAEIEDAHREPDAGCSAIDDYIEKHRRHLAAIEHVERLRRHGGHADR